MWQRLTDSTVYSETFERLKNRAHRLGFLLFVSAVAIYTADALGSFSDRLGNLRLALFARLSKYILELVG